MRVSGEGVSGAGHVVAAGAGAMAVVARWAILGIDVFAAAAWIVHEFAVVANVEFAAFGVVCAVEVTAVPVAVVGAVAAVVRCLAFRAVIVVVVPVVVVNLRWFWLCNRVRVVDTYS